ncbi:hypothetical protein QJS10_CPA09g01887 [Acorus calamus]|uniref:Uncharacterized protein n=1 Tax=Acorus calamus TaxID=4465 RepID=A0AAV9E7H5_ACOCL|nr:hypothetical protein QJS10_CPA09g01887 [Acorus calamus]
MESQGKKRGGGKERESEGIKDPLRGVQPDKMRGIGYLVNKKMSDWWRNLIRRGERKKTREERERGKKVKRRGRLFKGNRLTIFNRYETAFSGPHPDPRPPFFATTPLRRLPNGDHPPPHETHLGISSNPSHSIDLHEGSPSPFRVFTGASSSHLQGLCHDWEEKGGQFAKAGIFSIGVLSLSSLEASQTITSERIQDIVPFASNEILILGQDQIPRRMSTPSIDVINLKSVIRSNFSSFGRSHGRENLRQNLFTFLRPKDDDLTSRLDLIQGSSTSLSWDKIATTTDHDIHNLKEHTYLTRDGEIKEYKTIVEDTIVEQPYQDSPPQQTGG